MCYRQKYNQYRGSKVGPCLAGTSNNMELHVTRVEVVMEILVVADTGMYGGGQVAYNVETYGFS